MDNEGLLLALPGERLARLASHWLSNLHLGYETSWFRGRKGNGVSITRPQSTASKGSILFPDFKTIRGVPQPIMKIPLKAGLGSEGMAIKELLHRVIIGPSDHSQVIARAYVDVLSRAGFEDPWSMISVSNIPLRQ
ncbi:hypothetical protein [Caulobacter sp. B11]|uniref:hypothetical protein n=1 Tax=Caulobacter sp. B11 TaxID=2048899 RepID=UPI001F24C664|nr:hypothetical protein [Caulobacter sp. B11]